MREFKIWYVPAFNVIRIPLDTSGRLHTNAFSPISLANRCYGDYGFHCHRAMSHCYAFEKVIVSMVPFVAPVCEGRNNSNGLHGTRALTATSWSKILNPSPLRTTTTCFFEEIWHLLFKDAVHITYAVDRKQLQPRPHLQGSERNDCDAQDLGWNTQH